MSTWAPNVSKHMPFQHTPRRSRNGKAVVGIIPHIGANAKGATVAGYVSRPNERNSHPTYVIQVDGTVIGVVHPDDRPTSTTNSIDEVAVTVEMDNTEYGGDWPVSQAQLDALAIITRHHADESPRAGKSIVRNDPSKVQEGFFVGDHSQYRQVTCAGPFVIRNLPDMIHKANTLKPGDKPAPAPQPAPTPSQPAGKSISQLADEVMRGEHGNGDARRKALGDKFGAVQDEINRRLRGQGGPAKPAAKTISQLADEVIAGKYGSGQQRKDALGGQYSAVQDEVNRKLGIKKGGGSGSRGANIHDLAVRTIRGDFGNGVKRKAALGANYSAVMAEVNRLL